MKSAPSIAFDYRAPKAIVALASAIIVASTWVPWLSAMPAAANVALSLGVAAYGVVALRRFARAAVVRIAYRATGWVLVDSNGTERAADLASHARYGDFIALDFRIDRKRRFRALLGPGNADAETRRRLILLLSRAEVVQPA